MSDYWQPVHTPGAPVHSTCLNCPPRAAILKWRDNPSPGFGMVSIERDGISVAGTCGDAANLIHVWRCKAKADPGHVWTITIESPMSGVRYTRLRNGQWLATHRSMGFA